MRLRRFTDYLIQHRLLALVFTSLVTAVPVIGIVGILIATLMTLVKGAVEGAIFTLAATFPYLLSLYTAQTGSTLAVTKIMLWGAIGVAVLSNILTWAFAVMLRQRTSWSNIVQMAALLGVLVVSVLHLVYPDITEWWGAQLSASFKQAANMLSNLNNNETQLDTINATKAYATGMMTAGILFNAIIQLIVGRWWQTLLYKPASLRQELHSIRLNQLAGVLFLCSVIFAYWGNPVVLDIMPILYLLFAGAGLSVIHYGFGLMKSPVAWFWLALLYTSLLFAMPMSVILLAMIALADIWFDLRRRLRRF